MNAWKGAAAGRIRLQAELKEQRRGRNGGEGWFRDGGGGGAEGQDVCLPMSRDFERKKSREWDERREEGESR